MPLSTPRTAQVTLLPLAVANHASRDSIANTASRLERLIARATQALCRARQSSPATHEQRP